MARDAVQLGGRACRAGVDQALTLVSETGVPDEVYGRVREQFSEDELVHLSLAIVAINGWNRLNVAARTVPGGHGGPQPREVARGS